MGVERREAVRAKAPPAPEGSVVLAFPVPNELDGQRLDRFLAWRIPRLTRERAREVIEATCVDVEGRRRPPHERVRAKEIVHLVRERFEEPAAPRVLEVLHEDSAITVVSKPAGLPVHPSASYRKNTLTALLDERYGIAERRIAHRLDKETSGIVVCVAHGPAEVLVKKQFEGRSVAKEYLAIVRGEMADDEGEIDASLGRATEGLHMRMAVRADGLAALTRYRVLERRGGRSLVHLFPHTGRQHQLRVHLAHIGHPIEGDKLYGPTGDSLFFDVIEQGMTDELVGQLGHGRHALHAFRISFDHPTSGERVTYEAPLANDLVALFAGVPRRD